MHCDAALAFLCCPWGHLPWRGPSSAPYPHEGKRFPQLLTRFWPGPPLQDNSLLQMPPWKNPWLIVAMAVSFSLHFLILYVPFLAGGCLPPVVGRLG